MAARRYTLVKRAASMAVTRERILEAARRVFSDEGGELSIDGVAREAGVGRATVFKLYGSKRELLVSVLEAASQRAGVERLLAALAVEDPREALAAVLREGCAVWAAEQRVFRRLYGLAAVDDEVAEVITAKEARRREVARHLVTRLVEAGAVRPGISAERATALVWVVTSFATFDSLTSGAGLPVEEAPGAMAVLLESTLRA